MSYANLFGIPIQRLLVCPSRSFKQQGHGAGFDMCNILVPGYLVTKKNHCLLYMMREVHRSFNKRPLVLILHNNCFSYFSYTPYWFYMAVTAQIFQTYSTQVLMLYEHYTTFVFWLKTQFSVYSRKRRK